MKLESLCRCLRFPGPELLCCTYTSVNAHKIFFIIIRVIKKMNETREKEGMCRILFHTDAAQAIGKIPVDVKELGVDYLTIVGHKVIS